MRILPEDNERARLVLAYGFGYAVIFLYATLALVIALGKIEEKTSFGLPAILEALKPLGVLFCGWAFAQTVKGKE